MNMTRHLHSFGLGALSFKKNCSFPSMIPANITGSLSPTTVA